MRDTGARPGSRSPASGLRTGGAGTGPPVVLLHGFVGDSQEWRPVIDDLSDAFHVVAWDAPGSGHSCDPPESFRLADYADCLAAVIKALGLRRPGVVGLSLGGALALSSGANLGSSPSRPKEGRLMSDEASQQRGGSAARRQAIDAPNELPAT